MSTAPFVHGELRGSDDPRRSRTFEGRFGRLFRSLDPAEFALDDTDPEDGRNPLPRSAGSSESAVTKVKRESASAEKALEKLAHKMLQNTKAPPPETDLRMIPAGYTYLGQFIGHDITFDPASSLQRDNDPDGLVDYRTPRFDLDCIYGRGPADQPYLYQSDGVRMRLGERIGIPCDDGAPPEDYDVPRVAAPSGQAAVAIVGDPRNDENVIITQLHAMFLRFHNRVADEFGYFNRSDIAKVQQIVRWHYQWIVLYDFLPRIVTPEAYRKVLPHVTISTNPFRVTPDPSMFEDQPPQLRFYKPKQEAFIPVEFSAAAYRFGHSMVRDDYQLNPSTDRGVGGRFRIMPRPDSSGHLDFTMSLAGRRRFRRDWAIDWRLFFDFDGMKQPPLAGIPEPPEPVRPQASNRIDTSVAEALKSLPEFMGQIASLPERNLLRGWRLQLPSGHAVANAMGHPPNPETKEKLKPLEEVSKAFVDNAPLWYYILAEADGEGKGQLGPVGGRIVMETMVGLMMEDGHSFLRSAPAWRPDFMQNGRFGMAELIQAARQVKVDTPKSA